MTSLTEAKKWVFVINKAIYYSLIVLSTSPLLVFFFLIFQINYCGGFSFFLKCRSFFPTKTMNCNGGLVSACLYKERETGRLKYLGGGDTPHNGLYGEAPPEKGTFFRLQEYKRVEVLLVEEYERVGKSVIWVCERTKRATRWILWLYKVEEISVINSYLNDSAFTEKRMQSSKQGIR